MKTWQKILLVAGAGGIVAAAILLKRRTPPPPPLPKTNMVVTEVPPSSGPVGMGYWFGGHLEDEDGNVLGGKPIKFYEIYNGTIIGEGSTDYSEGWRWHITIKYTGVTTVYCEFPGDADYEGSLAEYDVVGT